MNALLPSRLSPWILVYYLALAGLNSTAAADPTGSGALADIAPPAPAVEVVFPHEGEVVDTPKVAFALAFQQDLAVDAASVAIQQAGRTLRTQCRPTTDGAVCVLDEPRRPNSIVRGSKQWTRC